MIQKALPYLAKQTDAWITKHKCASCHQVPHSLWAMKEAQARGFAVDKRVDEWTRWSTAFVLRDGDEGQNETARARDRVDEVYQMLLLEFSNDARPKSLDSSAQLSAREELVEMLFLGQTEPADWRGTGQLVYQNRPERETDESTSLWIHHTLSVVAADDARTKEVRAKADANLRDQSRTIEHLALRYLFAVDDGQSSLAENLLRTVLFNQNDDGGWGWKLNGSSDALGTGYALYALTYTENARALEAINRARKFLATTQREDGSWEVPSTLKRMNGKAHEVSDDWGTAWAVIGLSRSGHAIVENRKVAASD